VKIFKDWFQVLKIVFSIIFLLILVVAVEIGLVIAIDKWTNNMEFLQGMVVMIACYAVLSLILLGGFISSGLMIVELVRIGVKDLYEKYPDDTKEGAETIYELLRKIKDKKKQISVAMTIFLVFLDVVPPLKKIFKNYLRKLRKEVAPAP